MRYCPSWRHAKLLLTLLCSDLDPTSAERVETPGLIVLADLAGLFAGDLDEGKENLPPRSTSKLGGEGESERGGGGGEGGGIGEEDAEAEGGARGKRHGGKGEEAEELGKDAWEYWTLVSAAKQAALKFNSGLVVLEHRDYELTLPGNASRTVSVCQGLRKILGHVVTTRGGFTPSEEKGSHPAQAGRDPFPDSDGLYAQTGLEDWREMRRMSQLPGWT